jgi:hypothetical protein
MSFSIYSSVVSLSDLTLNFSQVSRHFGQGNLESERKITSSFCLFQFIVVSLKDGMFNNANVLFRTKFVDGMSTVTRTEVRTDNKRK